MKKRLTFSILAVVAVIFMLSSCGGGGSSLSSDRPGAFSSSTGWEYNTNENGGFEVADFVEQETGPGLVLIEGGAFQMGRTEQDLMYNWNSQNRRVTVSSFYMDETEVKNIDYLEFLTWTRRVFPKMNQVYIDALPDTLVWRRRMAYNEPSVEYYLRHPAYYMYPVVGVTWIQAKRFCEWRTDRVNEQILISEGILSHDPANQTGDNNFNTEAYLAGAYIGTVDQNLPNLTGEGDRAVRMEDGILLPRYRLPTEAEWEYAALSLLGNSITSPERIWSHRLYPWNGHYLRRDSKKDLGKFLANFKRGRGDMMGVAGALNDNGSITVPANSYWPNDFGLYCMAGNVNEWVFDVYRALTSQDVEDLNPVRGNIFSVKETKDDGTYVAKDSLGRMKYREMSDEESKNRRNYKKAYNVNYNDGDLMSSIIEEDWTSVKDVRNSNNMYKQGDESGKGMSSLVTDKARVYKGGGWRDRAYWLSPGNRRFLNEDEARDDLGFRCAMDRMGSPTGRYN